MKTVVFVLLLLLFTCNLSAQKSFPTWEDKPVWSVEWSGMYNHGGVDIYYYMKDTTIKNSPYQILICGGAMGCTLPVYIRVDGKKVWAKYWVGQYKKEYLFYDFSLNTGDSTYVGKPYGANGSIDTVKVKVINVDSVLTEAGYRKRLHVNFPLCAWIDEPYYTYWIEGIGGEIPYYFFNTSCQTDLGFDLSCYQENNIVIYKRYPNSNCKWQPSSIDKFKKENISLYPNPVLNELNITLPQTFNSATVDIYSIDGKTVYSNTSFNPFEPIDISNFVEGVYIVRVIAGEDTFYERILKQ